MKEVKKTPKRIKLTWLTTCPWCGKSHINLWLYLKDSKKSLYNGICPKTKEEFTLEVHL